MKQFVRIKEFYDEPLTDNFSEDMVQDCFSVFACRHKFCREVCPVYQEERNEEYISYGFHSSLLAASQGLGSVTELAEPFTYCLECGACELRCPNTLYASDFYRRSTTTVDLVRKVRRDLLSQEVMTEQWRPVQQIIDNFDRATEEQTPMTRWAESLNLPRQSEVVLFNDHFSATQSTENLRLLVMLLRKAGINPALYGTPKPTTGELLDTDRERFRRNAKENVEGLNRMGARTVVVVNPHDYMYMLREYPQVSEAHYEVVFFTDLLWRLVNQGKLQLPNPQEIRLTYHDPCTLNKFVGLTESPRNLLKAIPGVEFIDEDPVTQWQYCCGNGTSRAFRVLHPETSYAVGQKRLEKALDLEVSTLALACPQCEDQFLDVEQRANTGIEPTHLLKLLAKSAGIE